MNINKENFELSPYLSIPFLFMSMPITMMFGLLMVYQHKFGRRN